MIYLDNASTTKPLDCVRQKAIEMLDLQSATFGNPSSMHSLGMAAKREVEEARNIIAGCLGVATNEVFFTSGGTEANAIALAASRPAVGGLNGNSKILTSRLEHPSVLENLRNSGADVQYIDVSQDGKIDLDHFEKLLDSDVSLVSCMQVNNETGAIQPIAEMRGIMREKGSEALLHVDAVQGFGKDLRSAAPRSVTLRSAASSADLMTISSHKIGGLKGAGALYVKNGVKVKPLTYGGGQEKGIRPGTENVLAIACFGVAAKATFDNLERNYKHVAKLNARARELLSEYRILSPADGSPYILNVAISGVMAETVLHSLEMKTCGRQDVYIGIGSACSANKKSQMSETLLAMGVDRELIKGSVRLSFAPENTLEEVEEACVMINQVVADLRRIRR